MRALACALLIASPAAAQWPGFTDVSAEVDVARYDFGTSGGSNENYYDGDFGDFDGDGRIDRALISRYGLLWNSGGGVMIPVSTQRSSNMGPNTLPSLTGYLFGDEVSIGNDAVQWVDLDSDGDLDVVQGGNGEPLVVQRNQGGRFSEQARLSGSAVQIVTTDLERDGDADLIVACWFPSGPDDFSLFVNDGGILTEDAAARGVAYAGSQIMGVASGDLDRDGDFDIVLLSRAANEVWVLENDGSGRFTRTTFSIPGTLSGTSGFSQGTNLGDLDDDGDLDLVVATDDYVGSNMRAGHMVWINDGSGAFTEESGTRLVIDASFAFVGRLLGSNGKLLDVDYDGDLDFVAFTDLAGPPLNLQLFLNDGGVLRYTRDGAPRFGAAETSSVGADLDVADLDHDGVYDLWVGVGGTRVAQLRNGHDDPRGDQPRNLRVLSTDGGVRLRFDPPPFAATARHYVVYRSLSPGREVRDRTVLRTVAISRFEDEGFSAPITRFTRSDEIGDPDVTIDAGSVEVLDRSAAPGVRYFYSVAHVGPENARSRPGPEVEALVAGSEARSPELEIVSPTADEWSAHPRIAVTFGDADGIDESSIEVTLDRAAGSIAAGTNLVDRATVRSASAVIVLLDQPLAIGAVTVTARVRDLAGNMSERTRRFGVSIAPGSAPSASAVAEPASGEAPLTVRLRGEGTDDGEILRWEWAFGDGSTDTGREVEHTFAAEGTYEVTLRARDDSGAVAFATVTVEVAPCQGDCTPIDAGTSPGEDAGMPPIDRIPARTGCGCGVSPRSAPLWALASFLLFIRRR